MEGGCGIAKTAGYGAGSQVHGERGYGAPGPGDIPQGRIIGRMDDGALPSRWAGYERRVPSSLEDLRGQATGLVELPLHVAWSGRRVYDVGDDDQRLRGLKVINGLLSFYAVCSIGAVANVGIATAAFGEHYSWWISGLAGSAVGVVWNYAASSVFTWRPR